MAERGEPLRTRPDQEVRDDLFCGAFAHCARSHALWRLAGVVAAERRRRKQKRHLSARRRLRRAAGNVAGLVSDIQFKSYAKSVALEMRHMALIKWVAIAACVLTSAWSIVYEAPTRTVRAIIGLVITVMFGWVLVEGTFPGVSWDADTIKSRTPSAPSKLALDQGVKFSYTERRSEPLWPRVMGR